jgi:hypothetical protein
MHVDTALDPSECRVGKLVLKAFYQNGIYACGK